MIYIEGWWPTDPNLWSQHFLEHPNTHRIHVWDIGLHLPQKQSKIVLCSRRKLGKGSNLTMAHIFQKRVETQPGKQQMYMELIPFVPWYPMNIPIGSMYGIFTYIYHKNQPNAGKYTIHGSYQNMARGVWTLRLLLGGNVRFQRQRLGESSILGVNGWGFGKEVGTV